MTTLFKKFQKRISSNAAINPNGAVLVFLFKHLCELIEIELTEIRKKIKNKPIGRMF